MFNGIFASLKIKAKTNRITDNVRPPMPTIIANIPELGAKPDVASSIEAMIKVVTKVSAKTKIDNRKRELSTPIGGRLISNVCLHCGHVTIPR